MYLEINLKEIKTSVREKKREIKLPPAHSGLLSAWSSAF